jgi:hypothetical protein
VTLLDPSPFTFPPSPPSITLSKKILEFWKALNPEEILEWEELARDIRSAYAQLVSQFGSGILFDGNAWEDQRHYHARNLFFKWTGYQAVQSVSIAGDTTSVYVPVSMAQTVSSPLSHYCAFKLMMPPILGRKWTVNLLEDRLMPRLPRICDQTWLNRYLSIHLCTCREIIY